MEILTLALIPLAVVCVVAGVSAPTGMNLRVSWRWWLAATATGFVLWSMQKYYGSTHPGESLDLIFGVLILPLSAAVLAIGACKPIWQVKERRWKVLPLLLLYAALLGAYSLPFFWMSWWFNALPSILFLLVGFALSIYTLLPRRWTPA